MDEETDAVQMEASDSHAYWLRTVRPNLIEFRQNAIASDTRLHKLYDLRSNLTSTIPRYCLLIRL